MNRSQELDLRTFKDRLFRMRVGAPERAFRERMIPFMDRFSVFPGEREAIHGSGEYEYQHFIGHFSGNEVIELKKITNANNWASNCAIDVLPVWKIDRLTIPEVIREVTSCLKHYREVKFHASKPWIPGGNNNEDFDGKYDLVIFTLDKIDSEEMLFGALKGKYYYLERESYYKQFEYLPKFKDTHDGPW